MEIRELTAIRFARHQPAAYCRECQKHTRHFSVAQSGAVLSLSEPAIFRLAENGRIHSTETADGRLILCSGSLFKLQEMISTQGENDE